MGMAAVSRGGAARPKNNTPIIVGAAVGGLVLLVILAVALSGGSERKKHSDASNAKKPSGRPVDVSGLEREGRVKCDEGLACIQRCDGLLRQTSLSAGDKAKLVADLERGKTLISEGMGMWEEANRKTNGESKFDTQQYQQALIMARKKLQELRSN